MNVWAISDLHLSFARPDKRERFAARWRDHAARIEQHWRERVARDDLVLLPGDLSMARNHRDLQPDLVWLDRLPGTKVLSPGNHDQWWNSVTAIRPLLRESIRAVDGDALTFGGAVVCGAAGYTIAGETPGPREQEKVERALESLRQALEDAARLRPRPDVPLYVLWHYPPYDVHGLPGPCVDLLEQAGTTVCVYGHLHGQKEWSAAVHGLRRSVRYYCVAADAVGFCPLRIDNLADEMPESVAIAW
jgi:predicted phosphohydrolase